jgi:uncharacterized phosphosugar-binding protein
MILTQTYFKRLHQQLEELERRSLESINQVAKLCANRLMNGGVIHLYDTGHLVSRELVNRAGGLAAMSAFTFDLNVANLNPYRERKGEGAKTTAETMQHIVAAALDKSRVLPGDVLIIGSVSGKTPNVVELALQARARGVHTVAITAMDYSSKLQSEHHTGKRLFEATDFVIDNAAPYGDGMLTHERLDVPFCPASGLGAASALWAVTAGIIEHMAEHDEIPTVLASINRPDGQERYKQSIERYAETGK